MSHVAFVSQNGFTPRIVLNSGNLKRSFMYGCHALLRIIENCSCAKCMARRDILVELCINMINMNPTRCIPCELIKL